MRTFLLVNAPTYPLVLASRGRDLLVTSGLSGQVSTPAAAAGMNLSQDVPA